MNRKLDFNTIVFVPVLLCPWHPVSGEMPLPEFAQQGEIVSQE
jgi:hypothetical protein